MHMAERRAKDGITPTEWLNTRQHFSSVDAISDDMSCCKGRKRKSSGSRCNCYSRRDCG